MEDKRFFLDTDPSSHWYIVPEEHRAEWERWCDLPEDDEAGWEIPEWANPIGVHPNRITFTDPEGDW